MKPEDLVVSFDCIHEDYIFRGCTGRELKREEDGFYHCYKPEWESVKHFQGLTLIEERAG